MLRSLILFITLSKLKSIDLIFHILNISLNKSALSQKAFNKSSSIFMYNEFFSKNHKVFSNTSLSIFALEKISDKSYIEYLVSTSLKESSSNQDIRVCLIFNFLSYKVLSSQFSKLSLWL